MLRGFQVLGICSSGVAVGGRVHAMAPASGGARDSDGDRTEGISADLRARPSVELVAVSRAALPGYGTHGGAAPDALGEPCNVVGHGRRSREAWRVASVRTQCAGCLMMPDATSIHLKWSTSA